MRVAVTGSSGTVGRALAPLLEQDGRVERVVGVSSRGGGPRRGKLVSRRGDVRDVHALERAFAGADVVIHLAFALYGVSQGRTELHEVNVEGTANAFLAARRAGARRFVHASSVAAYGLEDGRHEPYVESDPVRPDPRHFYVEQKARAEITLRRLSRDGDRPELVVVRPCGIAGPHAAGAASHSLGAAAPALSGLLRGAFGAGLRPPVMAPTVPIQFLHEADAARGFVLAALDGPPGIYNLVPDDAVDGPDLLRALGLPSLPLPRAVRDAALRAAAAAPLPLPMLRWAHLMRFPVVADGSRARRELGWEPSMGSADALASTRAAWSA